MFKTYAKRQTVPLFVAGLISAAILAFDIALPSSHGLGSLYVIPLLIATFGGPRYAPLLFAWSGSLLVVVRLLTVPWAGVSQVVFTSRLIDIVALWVTASIAARLRETTLRLEESTRDLRDLKYAIDQSAIVAATNPRGTITYVNDKFCEISKYSREELLGRDHRILNSGYHPKEFMRNLWTTIGAGRIWRGEIRNRAKDGTLYWVDTTIVPFLDEHKQPYQYMAIRYEITDRKRSEERLREQEALARLGQMAAVVAHEVKNPIAGIRGALQVIVSRMAPEQRDRTIMGDIIARLDALNGIVQDLLLFARPRTPHYELFDAAGLVESTAELLRRDPAFGGVRVTVSGRPAPITADPELLRIVLQNLLMNAAQAMGGRGDIDVTLSGNGERSIIVVRDHGPGMPVEVRDKAFEAFFTTKHRGTGLGLPIARRLIEAHGGRIGIDAPEDGGTVVAIELPGSTRRV